MLVVSRGSQWDLEKSFGIVIVEYCVWKIVELCIFRKDLVLYGYLFANLLNIASLSCQLSYSILHVQCSRNCLTLYQVVDLCMVQGKLCVN